VIDPPLSYELVPLKETVSGPVPEVGVALMTATGGLLTGADTVIWTVPEEIIPELSVTVRRAVKVPVEK